MRTMLDVSAAVGEADGGTSWVVTLLNVCSWLVGLYPGQAQDDVCIPGAPHAQDDGNDRRDGQGGLQSHGGAMCQPEVAQRRVGRDQHGGDGL